MGDNFPTALNIRDEVERIVNEKFFFLFPFNGQVSEVPEDDSGAIMVKIPQLGWDTPDLAKKCYPSNINSQITPKVDDWVIVRFTGFEMEIGRYEYKASEIKGMLPKQYKKPSDAILYEDPGTGDYIKYDVKNKKLEITITGDVKIQINGNAVIDANQIQFNGNTNSLTMFQQLKAAIDSQNTDLSGKFAQIQGVIGVPVVSAVTTNIDAAQASSLKTNG